MENLARYVDKEEKTEIELIIRAYLVAWIFQVANTQYRGFLVLTDHFGLQINCILADMPSQTDEHFPTHGSREEMIAGSCTQHSGCNFRPLRRALINGASFQRSGCNFRTLRASPLMETAQAGRLPMTPRARRAAPAGAVWTR